MSDLDALTEELLKDPEFRKEFEKQKVENEGMTPDEFRRTQQGGRWYQLWLRERNPLKKADYQRMFNEDLKKINGGMKNEE